MFDRKRSALPFLLPGLIGLGAVRGHILALDCLLGRDIHQRQPGENDLRVAVRRVGVGENLIAVALPNRVRAGVVGVIVRKAEG